MGLGAVHTTIVTCHPDRQHHAKSLCKTCYTNAYQRSHRPLIVKSQREYLARHRDKPRRDWLKWSHGITTKQYESMLDSQGGVCAICGQPSIGGRFLAVDHDHRTGVIRGLLCMNCNRMLGQADDDPSRLLRAVAYLTKDA